MSSREATRYHGTFPKDRRVIVSDGTPIAYTVRGEGEGVPVVFINGWTCPDSYWVTIGPAVMNDGHRVLYVDVRGHGESGLPRAPGLCARNLRREDVSAQRLTGDVLEAMTDAGIERAAFVGHSMGAQLLVEAARLAPERVAALIPVAGAFENPVKTFANQAVLDRLYPVAETLFKAMPLELLTPVIKRTAKPSIGVRVVHAIHVGGPKVTADDVAGHMEHVGAVNFSVLLRIMSELRRHETADFLPSITAPTLVLGGSKDVFTPPSVQKRMAELVPGAEIVWFEDAGHLLPAEEPEGVAAAINDFLRRRVR